MSEKGSKKIIFIGAAILFFILLLMSQVFYRERLFADSSYYAVNIIQWERFRFDHHRFILIFAEWLPLLAIKLGLNLSIVLRLYSLGHVLFFLLLFLVVFLLLKDYWAALAILMIHITNTLFLYFTPMVEIWYGAGLSILFYTLVLKKNTDIRQLLLLAALEITVLFSHPENFILVFTFLALAIEKERKLSKTHLVLGFVLIAVIIVKFMSFSSYESEKVNHALDFEGSVDTLHLLDPAYCGELLLMLCKNYYLVVFLFVVSAFYLVKNKKWLRLGVFAAGFLGTIVLVNSVTTANMYDWYFEAMYLPMVTISIAVFFSDTIIVLNTPAQKALLTLLGFFAVYTLSNQWNATHSYTERVNQLQSVVQKLDGRNSNKFIVKPEQIGFTPDALTWSIPMEALLLSAERGREFTQSIGTSGDLDFEDVRKITKDSSYFMLRKWDIIKNEQLNKKYFISKPGAYQEAGL